MTLDDLLLSCRAEAALVSLGCRTFRDVCRLTATDLLTAPNCGKESIREIDAALGRFSLCLHAPTKRIRMYDSGSDERRRMPCKKARRRVLPTPDAADRRKEPV